MEKELRDIVIDYKNNLVTSPPFNVLRSSAKNVACRKQQAMYRRSCSHHTAVVVPMGAFPSIKNKIKKTTQKKTLKVWLYIGLRTAKSADALPGRYEAIQK